MVDDTVALAPSVEHEAGRGEHGRLTPSSVASLRRGLGSEGSEFVLVARDSCAQMRGEGRLGVGPTRARHAGLEAPEQLGERRGKQLAHRNQRLARSFVFKTAGDQSGT